MMLSTVPFDQSGLMPPDLMTRDHSSVCDAMNAAKSSGVLGVTMTPSSASLFPTAGLASALLISMLSCRTISGGVLTGDAKPHQTDDSQPERPASATVGTSGNNGTRFSLATASARSLPARTCAITSTGLIGMNAMRSPSKSVIAGAPPL